MANIRSKGITVVELLIVVAILGVLVGIAVLNGFRVFTGQEARAAVTSIQQTVWQGATAAAARGVVTRLSRSGDSFVLTDTSTDAALKRFDLPESVTFNWEDGQSLNFLPPGRVEVSSLDALPNPLVIEADGVTSVLTISLIGEVKAVAQ